jgi:hypothetical protein
MYRFFYGPARGGKEDSLMRPGRSGMLFPAVIMRGTKNGMMIYTYTGVCGPFFELDVGEKEDKA